MLKKGILIFVFFSLFFSFTSCKKEAEPSKNFPLASKYNIDEDQLSKAYTDIKNIEGSLCLVIARNGEIVAEEYINGGGPDVKHDVRSCTKSLMSLLIGIALDKGYIKDLNEPISKYLDGIVIFPDDKKANITIENMLKMAFGHEWNGTSTNSLYNKWASTPDHLQFIIDLPLTSEPGTVFNYSDGASHYLSVILTVATGKNTFEYAKENLFGQMGIVNVDWETDDLGYNNGAAGLSITPHDMVKIGNLILSKGKYNGIQLVPESWIDLATTAKINSRNNIPYGQEYGYQWWVGSDNGQKFKFAMGWGGQFLCVVPDKNLVVVSTCIWKNVGNAAYQHWNDIINVIVKEVLPAVK